MIFFRLFFLFQLFSSGGKLPKVDGQSEQVKNTPFEGGVDGFNYLSLIFIYFIF